MTAWLMRLQQAYYTIYVCSLTQYKAVYIYTCLLSTTMLAYNMSMPEMKCMLYDCICPLSKANACWNYVYVRTYIPHTHTHKHILYLKMTQKVT